MKKLQCSLLLVPLLLFHAAYAQNQARLFFREDFKEIEAALPVTQEHVANPRLQLALYGPASGAIKKSNHPNIPNDPYYIWSGECKGNWAVAFRHTDFRVNLDQSGAKIKLRCRQSGFRQLRIIVKLADDSWVVSDQSHGASDDWEEVEFLMANMRWRQLNIGPVTEGNWMEKVDLRGAKEVGFTDLMSGGGTPASSRVDWIEVWGFPMEK